IAQADVANRDQMRDVLVQARERFGRIDGVIHAAGIADGALIARRTRATTDAVLSPKLQGTLVLQELFSDTKPDFLILCSALSSVLGGYGQVGYCAANAFLDAFAQGQSATAGTLTVAINWDAWREVGMAVETDSSSHGGDAPPHLDSSITKQTPYDARLV